MCDMSIDCCLSYKLIYEKLVRYHLEKNPNIGWDLDSQSIFNHVDAFIQRLKDLIEICESMIVFGRYDETEKIPRSLFGSERGIEFERTCQEIERQFNDGLELVCSTAGTVLDVHTNSWYRDVGKFQTMLRNLEDIVEQLISNVFLSVSNVEEGIEALCSLINFSYRKNLRPSYLRKTTEVWNMFIKEIAETNQSILDQTHQRPSHLPKYSGKATVLKIQLDRLTRLKNLLEEAKWLPVNSNSYKALHAYETLKTNVTKNIQKLNEDWIKSIGIDCVKKLNRPLMCRSVSHPGLLECNIDRQILTICEEARYFELLKFKTPLDINKVYSKHKSIKFVYESVVTVVLDYNKILSALSDKERILFRAMITSCERKITPGIYKLTWDGEMSDEYIAECVKHTAKLQEFVDIYKIGNLSVVQICEQICDTPLIQVDTSCVVELKDLKISLSQHRNEAIVKILKLYKNIVNLILIVYEGFESQIDNVRLCFYFEIYNFYLFFLP